ncbi:MAG: VOC family protein, partial [Pseudomonadota bacterium]
DGNGPSLHLAAPASLSETADRVRKAGGKVLSDPIEIPFGSFFYAMDPDGNSLGFFEPKG